MMTDKLTIEDRGDYVLCTQGCIGTRETLLDSARAISDWCGEHGRYRAIWDWRNCEVSLSVMDRYDLATSAAEFWNRRIRLAVLGLPEQALPDRFGQTVANNRGIAVKICFSLDESLAWLGLAAGSVVTTHPDQAAKSGARAT